MSEVPGPSSTETTPPSVKNLEAFKELFPGVIQDGVLDAARLGDLLNTDVAGIKNGKEQFGLMWAGRKNAVEAIQATSLAALVPDEQESIAWDTAENVFIEGDNLEVLKLLQNAYNDQVKLIYIDPPYNTGNDFVYNDDFSDQIQHYLEITGQVDADGNRLVANTETTGRKHSNWLTMMYPRLFLARNMLTQDGSIFVSIDDNEVHHLRSLMDEIFGPENFIGQFVWAAGRKNDAKFVSASHEYVICYSRNSATLKQSVGEWRQKKSGLEAIYSQAQKLNRLNGSDYATSSSEIKAWFRNLPEGDPSKRHKQYSVFDERGLYFPGDIAWPGGGGPKFDVLHPSTKLPAKVPSTGWRFTEERMAGLLSENRVHFGKDETTVPCIKRYLTESEFEVPYSVFYQDGRSSTKRLSEFLGGGYFDFPKDEFVIQNIVEFASDKESIVMDFFAGSGTTGHAVALQNAKDGGNRKYVLVTLDEPTAKGSFARSKGVEKVSDITLMRLKKVTETIEGAARQGLRVMRLAKSSFVRSVTTLEDGQLVLNPQTLVPEAKARSVVSEMLLQVGVRLDSEWQLEAKAGMEFIRSGNTLCQLGEVVTDELIGLIQSGECTQLLLREDSFAGRDALRSNAFYEAKKYNVQLRTY